MLFGGEKVWKEKKTREGCVVVELGGRFIFTVGYLDEGRGLTI